MAEPAPGFPFVLFYQPPVTVPAPVAGGWQVAQLDAEGVATPIDATIYASYAAAHARCMRENLGLETAPAPPPPPVPPPEPPPEDPPA